MRNSATDDFQLNLTPNPFIMHSFKCLFFSKKVTIISFLNQQAISAIWKRPTDRWLFAMHQNTEAISSAHSPAKA